MMDNTNNCNMCFVPIYFFARFICPNLRDIYIFLFWPHLPLRICPKRPLLPAEMPHSIFKACHLFFAHTPNKYSKYSKYSIYSIFKACHLFFPPQAIHSLFQSIEYTDIFLHQSVDDATLGWNIPRYHGWIFKRSSRNMPCYSNSTNYKRLSFIHNAHNGPISSRVIWVREAVYDPECYYSVMWNGCKESFHICFPIDFLSGLPKASCSR